MYNTYVHRGRYKAGRQANWAQALENVKLIFRKTHKHIKQILIYVCANVFQIHFGICVGESVRCMDGIERVSARYVSLSRTKDPRVQLVCGWPTLEGRDFSFGTAVQIQGHQPPNYCYQKPVWLKDYLLFLSGICRFISTCLNVRIPVQFLQENYKEFRRLNGSEI